MKIALCLLVALCVLSITMANDYDRHGKGKSPYEIMDGPNPDHKPTGLPILDNSPKLMREWIPKWKK